ncbi:MAG: iron-containing alcohol dehydrogenase [Candidatus Gottesmanbacteria bacterium]|nr:iron-containing alcohol dehydrogenase [Candidatus Gottesmanbacteria bacterium]
MFRQSPKQFHAAGSVDVLSIYTALYDWKLASDRHTARPDELYVNAIADQANNILKYLMSNKIDIITMSQTGLKSIVQALCMEVELCNLYGNSRPEEGGEHFFAYAIEPHLPHAIHGELVGLGILITAYMQQQPWQDIQNFMDGIEMNYRPKGISARIVTDTLKGMHDYVKRHALRYGIWNEYHYDEQNVQTFLNAIHI